MKKKKKITKKSLLTDKNIIPVYARHALTSPIPKYEMPQEGMQARTAYDLIHDELIMDGNSRYNLATFVTTWMEPEARDIMMETLDKNMIDKDEYPQTAEIEERCVNMIGRLWNVPDKNNFIGCSTIGSSEAAMLGGMALKWKWKEKRRKMKKSIDKPNLVMGINVQICWEKFCRYWDIKPRYVYCEKNRFVIDPKIAAGLCDENTIGVIGIMGSTYDGSYEPIERLQKELDILQREKGLDIPIHVDAASGGFIAPFIQPQIKWDFRLERVKSINSSGHKYGMVYPGVGWIVWRDEKELVEDLKFYVSYLGGEMATFAINFSRPGSQICAQYYNFLRLGKKGYAEIQSSLQKIALHLSSNIAKMGPFKLISKGDDIPVFAWTLKGKAPFTLYELAERLRLRGWLVPAYPMPKNRDDLVVQRIAVKNGFSFDMADMLLKDIKKAVDYFYSKKKKKPVHQFRH